MPDVLIGQAVVTDPAVGGTSGYLLVAASESVRPEDRQHLEAMPQVSDYLHLARNADETFFSLHQLPSGAWAFSKRFFHGKRRGEFNRIVNHSLVLSSEALAAFLWEPSLLMTACRFCQRGQRAGEPYDQLTRSAGEPGLRFIQDVYVVAEEDLAESRYRLIESRRDYLRREWGEEDLIYKLAQVFAGVESPAPLLLPQDPATEQLLYLACSALPRADRMAAAWTTHLAPGGGAVFRLALTPNPREARDEQENPGDWRILNQSQPPLHSEGSEALARSVVMDVPSFRESDLDLERLGLNLGQNGLMAAQRLIHLEKSDDGPAEGFKSAGELAQYFDAHKITGHAARSPWTNPHRWLELAADTLASLYRPGEPWGSACNAVYAVLADKRRALAELLLTPGFVREIAGRPDNARRLIAALALSLETPAALSIGRKEDLIAALPRMPAGGFGKASGLPAAKVLSALTFGLARNGSPHTRDAFRLLGEEPGGLQEALVQLDQTPNLTITRYVFDAALATRNSKLAGQVAEKHAVPLLARYPSSAASLGEDLGRFLSALRTAPQGLVSALQAWPDELYGHAVVQLRQWIQDARPEALQVAQEAASDHYDRAIREHPFIVGLAEKLADGGAPASIWLPFALAEAVVLDDPDCQERGRIPFGQFLEGARIDGGETQRIAEEALRCLDRKDIRLGEAFRTVVEKSASGFRHQPVQTLRAFAQLSRFSATNFRAWGKTVATVASALSRGGFPLEASTLCRNWWKFLANLPWQALSPEAFKMLSHLRGEELEEIKNLWIPKLQEYTTHVGGRELANAFRDLAAADPNADPNLHVDLELEAIVSQVGGGQLDIEHGLAQAEEILWRANALHTIPKIIRNLLPKDGPDRARAVVRLLLSQHILPSTQRHIDRDFRYQALRSAKSRLPSALPPFSELARRPNLLCAVARQYGEIWEKIHAKSDDFIRWAAEEGKYDAVGAFLEATMESVWLSKPRSGYIERLSELGRSDLLAAFRKAIDDPVYGRDLAPFAGRIAELAVHL